MRWLAPRLALVLAGVAGALVLTELALRVTGLGSPVVPVDVNLRWEPGSPYLQRQAAPDLVLAPGFVGQMVYRSDVTGKVVKAVDVRTSSAGLRGAELDPTHARPRVLGIGDSLTFGQGVEEDETFLAAFARSASPPLEVLNGGVPSWNLRSEVAWFREFAPALDPDLVLLFTYINDVAPSVNLAPEGVEHPIRQLAPAWALREAGLRQRSYLLNLMARVRDRERLISELAAAAPSRRSRRMSYIQELWQDLDRDEVRRDYAEFKRLCTARRLPCVVVILPVLVGEADPVGKDLVDALDRIARSAGLPVVRTDDALAGLSGMARYVLPADRHPSAAAHQAIADTLVSRLPLTELLALPGP